MNLMKYLSKGIFVLMAATLILSGCGDSSDKVKTHAPLPSSENVNPNKGEAIEKLNTAGLEASVNRLIGDVFSDFQVVKMDPLDAFPTFQATKAKTFRRLQRKVPITSKVGKTYPRIILKGYEFASEEDAQKEARIWLSGLPSSADSVALGENIQSVKSPPLFCAITGKTFLIVQAACLYDGPEWQKNRELFFAEMEKRNAQYAWEVNCNKGELSYLIQPEN